MHPDVLDEMLNREQFYDWIDHYRRKPFGHWTDTEMLAQIATGLTSNSFQDCLPKVEELIDLENAEIEPESIPGCNDAEEWLRKNNGK